MSENNGTIRIVENGIEKEITSVGIKKVKVTHLDINVRREIDNKIIELQSVTKGGN